MAKKTVGIEALLTWAFRGELPKAQCDGTGLPALTGGFDPISAWVGDGAPEVVSDGRLNAYGLMPDRYASAEPHPDAIAVFRAVQGLADCALEMPEGWNPFADMPGAAWGARCAAEALNRLIARPALLVRKHAILGGVPDWGAQAQAPVERKVMERGQVKWFRQVQVTDSLGLPMTIEMDGRDRLRRRPFPDAYTKTEIVPDPVPLAILRAEYQLWRAALDVVAFDLIEACALQAHDVEVSALPWSPWIEGWHVQSAPRELPVVGWSGDLSRPKPVRAGRRGPRWSGEAKKLA